MSAPRLWFPMDALFPEQEIVKSLQTTSGPAGPWTLVFLLCEAYKRHFLKERPSGVVNMSYERLAREVGIVGDAFESPEDVVRGVMRNLSVSGIVEFLEGDLESATFRVRFLKWNHWTPVSLTDPTNAERQAKHRAKSADSAQSGNASLKVGSSVTLEGEGEKELPKGKGNTPVRDDVAKLCNLLADLIRKRDPKSKVAPSSKGWTDEMRLLIDKDGRTPAEVEHVIRWCQADSFWRVNILSVPKLRQKFDQLFAKAGKPKGTANDFFSRNGM